MTPPYWHDPEWRALLLAVVDEPEDAVRRARCCDWLEERQEFEALPRWGIGLVPTVYRCTSAEWYRQDDSGVYPCKELAWTLPIREVVFVDRVSSAEWEYGLIVNAIDRSALALRFARS